MAACWVEALALLAMAEAADAVNAFAFSGAIAVAWAQEGAGGFTYRRLHPPNSVHIHSLCHSTFMLPADDSTR